MLTKDIILKDGFKQHNRVSGPFIEYEKEVSNGYMAIRFEGEKATSLYFYTDGRPTNRNINIRKVVLGDVVVTKEDYERAKQLCKI